jgi:tetratricopeptide (TPR) repeat protein
VRGGVVRGGVLALVLLLAPGAASAGIFDREQEDVAAGNRALTEGDPAEALRRYEAAARDHGDAPEVAHDRGAALLAAGRHEEALAAFAEALARRGEGTAAAADHAGIGTALANLGRLDEAKAEFRKALELDPDQATARRNLEALLRRQEREEQQQESPQQDSGEQQESPQQEQQQDSGEQREPQEQQAGSGSEEQEEQRAGNRADRQEEGDSEQNPNPEEQAKDGSRQQDEEQAENQPRDGSGNETRPPEPQPGDENEPRPDGATAEDRPEEPADPGQQAAAGEGEEPHDGTGIPQAEGPAESAAPAGPIDRTEAEQLLDALQAGERPFQLYRRQRGRGERTDHDKDW